MRDVRLTDKFMKIGLVVAISVTLAACEDGKSSNLFKGKSEGGGIFSKKTTPETITPKDGSIKLVERDVESPEIFQATELALWDGRPSLGGVWVAHPKSKQPERVIIRNETNGKFIIGALFKRERNNPGPKLQLSSDAASALGVLAGAPTILNVTALRRETVPVNDRGGSPTVKAAAKPVTETRVATVPVNAPKLALPYIQLGFFSIEKNTLKPLETRKMPRKVLKATTKGKPFWRVLAGPAQTKGERDADLKEIKKIGFADAYLTKS